MYNAELDPKFRSIREAIRSPEQHVRGGGVSALRKWVEQDATIHEAALPLFQQVIDTETDGWSVTTAARGMQAILGVEAARGCWQSLLQNPVARLVAEVAQAIDDPALIPDLLNLLEAHPDQRVQCNAMRTLGRLRAGGAFGFLVQRLDDPSLQPDAIQALGELGNPEAIPYLQRLGTDTRELWQEDRGPMVRVCDLADAAIRRIQHIGNAAPPPLPGAPAPIPLPAFLRPRFSGAFRVPVGHPTLHKLAIAPVLIAILEIAWVAIILLLQPHHGNALTLNDIGFALALVPPTAGCVCVVIAIVRGHFRTTANRICLAIGSILNVAMLIGLVVLLVS